MIMIKNGSTFTDRIIRAIIAKRSILSLGLDPQIGFIPAHIQQWALKKSGNSFEAVARAFLRFNIETIDEVHCLVAAVKLQIAFYECYGHWGVYAYEKTIEYARQKGLVVITDGKRGDGGDTARAYAQEFLGEVPMIRGRRPSPMRVDCLTIHGYIATACVRHFVEEIKQHGTGAFVVAKTSFEPNSEVEQLMLCENIPVWQALAQMVSAWGEGTEGECGYRNLGVVAGATYPEDIQTMRQILPNAFFLIPGYGRQGGGPDGAVVSFNHDGLGGIVNSSRDIIAAWKTGRFKCDSKKYLKATRLAAEFTRQDLLSALERARKLNW
jgi:orotidine-5'-phosphate decarboxylase